MNEVFIHPDLTQVAHCRSILEEAGIPCEILHETGQELVAGLPDPACRPTLCVENDADVGRAKALLGEFLGVGQSDAPDWQCPQCGETVPGNFGSCWKCEAQRPGS